MTYLESSDEGWDLVATQQDRLRMARRQYAQRLGRTVTQTEFAKILDVPPDRYKRWETDTTCPNLVAIAKRLQLAIGVKAEDVAGLSKIESRCLGPQGPKPPGGGAFSGIPRVA